MVLGVCVQASGRPTEQPKPENALAESLTSGETDYDAILSLHASRHRQFSIEQGSPALVSPLPAQGSSPSPWATVKKDGEEARGLQPSRHEQKRRGLDGP